MSSQADRLEHLLAINWVDALNGDEIAIAVCLRQIERLATMFGLDP